MKEHSNGVLFHFKMFFFKDSSVLLEHKSFKLGI